MSCIYVKAETFPTTLVYYVKHTQEKKIKETYSLDRESISSFRLFSYSLCLPATIIIGNKLIINDCN